MTASRIHRMNPAAGSPNLLNFKRAYEHHKKYALFQAVRDPAPMGFKPIIPSAIMKSEIFFRQVDEIERGDPDSDAKVAPQ